MLVRPTWSADYNPSHCERVRCSASAQIRKEAVCTLALRGRRLEHAGQRMAPKRIAGIELLIKYIVALVPAAPLELGRMNAAIHPGRHRAALQAVASDHLGIIVGRRSPSLDDPRDAPAIDGFGSDDGEGEGAVAPASGGRCPHSPEQRALGDLGGLLPAQQRPDGA